MQDQGPKWKRRPTSGLLFAFGRDAIALIFKSKFQLRTRLNKSQIEDWFVLWHVFFCHLFLLNETTCFAKNSAVSWIVHKKSPKRCRFERHCRLSFSPKRAEKQGKEAAFPCIFTAFLPPFSSKTRWPRTPTCPKLSTCWRGGNTVATPSSISLVFDYKNRGSTREKRQKKERDREERNEREKRRREEKTEKIGEETVRTVIAGTTIVTSNCILPPPLPPAAPWATAGHPSSLSSSTFFFFFFCVFFSTFTLHMNNGEAHCLMGWQHRPGPKWLGWVRSNSKKNSFLKNCNCFSCFSY